MRHIICADQLGNTVLEPRGIVDMILGCPCRDENGPFDKGM